MGALLANVWQILLMGLLLLGSAFMSGSETAFFDISPRQLRKFRRSSHRFERLVAALLDNPKRLLTTLLFSNMAVNVLYFALSSVVSVRLGEQIGPWAGWMAGALAFVGVLLLGEMLPKSLAYMQSARFSTAAAPICFVLMRVLSPLLRFFEVALIVPALHLLLGPTHKQEPEEITPDQLKVLLDASRQRGVINQEENQLLGEVLELGMLKVRHVTQPRVDMVSCEIETPAADARRMLHERHLIRMCVYEKEIDNIVGAIHLRELLLEPEKPLRDLVRPVHFVPEQKNLDSLLEFFRRSGLDFAVVVDEYGGITGTVAVEDIATELVGPLDEPRTVEPVEPIGPLTYRLAAGLSIHEWGETFGIAVGQSRYATVGGLATALLGRIPRPGDAVRLRNVRLEVEEVRRHRIMSLILTLEPLGRTDAEPGEAAAEAPKEAP